MATGFFDLNIPYEPPSTSSATHNTALKLAVRAMELGYTGIAYNRTITATHDPVHRCSIPLLSPSSLLAFAPSLASSIPSRRDLLSVPRSSPFRQYTRLTFIFDNLSQAPLLTEGNAVVSSYDIFAVQPLTQAAFDYACETAEVDIISIDFVGRLPFRLKMPMVYAAIKRGVHFEINYSGLVYDDVFARKQALITTKLLIHMTKAKNLIISSAAPSSNEFRGPYDVANLLSLTGLSMERAKAAISRNCRKLITNVLRKKHFYKETIRAEPLSPNGKSDFKEYLALDLSTWDPISSGGDLQLDNLAQYFLDSTTASSKTVKAIDFSSLVDNGHSCGEMFSVGIKPNEVAVVTRVSELVPGADQTSITNIEPSSACVADGVELDTFSTVYEKADIFSKDIHLLSPSIEMPTTSLGSDVHEVQSAFLDDEQMVLDTVDGEDRSAAEGVENIRKSEDVTVILSDHVPFHIMGDDMEAGVSLFSKYKNYKEAMQELEQECRDVASEPGLLLDDHHIPLLATSDDKKVAVANCEALNVVDVEEQEQDVGNEKVFVQEDDSIVKDSSSVSMGVYIEQVKEEEEHIDRDIKSILVLDDDLKVKAKTSVQPGKAKKKRKKHKALLSPSETLEEHKNEGGDINCIPILKDCSNVKDNDNSSFLSSSGKARRKQKKDHQLLTSPSKPLEEHKHEDVDTSNIPFLDHDSNVKDVDNSSIPSPPGKARRKRKKHQQPLLPPSEPLEEHRHEDADVDSNRLLNDELIVKDKNDYLVSSPSGKAKAKRRRHDKKSLSPSKHVEEEQHGKIDDESILVSGGDSNAKDSSSIPYSPGVSLFPVGVKPNEDSVLSGATEKPGGNNLVLGIDHTSAMDVDSNSACVADGAEFKDISTSDAKTDILSKNINLLPPNVKMPVSSQGSDVVLKVQNTVLDGDRMALDIKGEGRPVTENILGRGSSRKSEVDTLILSDRVPFHVMDDDMKTDVSLVSNCKNHEQPIQELEQEHGDAASEPRLLPDDHPIPLVATSDDKKVIVANCETLSVVAGEEQEQGVGIEEIFVREEDSIVKDNSSVSRGVCIEEVKEAQEQIGVDTESNLVLDDLKVKANTPGQLGKAKRKRRKQKPLLSPSNLLEEHKIKDTGNNSIPILDDNSNDKEKTNSPTLSSPGKAKRKRKKQKTLLSPSNLPEEHKNEDIGTIPILDDNSNDKEKTHSSTLSSPGKAKRKQKKQRPLLSPSNPLEEHKNEDIGNNSIPILNDNSNDKDKTNSSTLSSPGKAKRKRKKQKPLLSASNPLEEHKNEDIGNNSIPILDDNSNDKDKTNSSTLSSPGNDWRKKRKNHHQSLLSSPKPLEDHRHEDIDANNSPLLDCDSNVKEKDDPSFSFSPENAGKGQKKRKKHRQSLVSSSQPLEEHRHEDADINSTPLLDDDQNVKDYSISSSPGKAKVKERRHRKKGVSSFKNLEEQHGKIDAENISVPAGDS